MTYSGYFKLGLLALIATNLSYCKFTQAPKAPSRSGANDSIVIPESVVFERSADGTSLNLNFETRVAAQCKLGFFVAAEKNKSSSTLVPCAGKSATKFAELVSGLPKDQLVTIVILSWPSGADEKSARSMVVNEAPPSAGLASINFLAVDLGGGRLELSSFNSTANPSNSLAETLSKSSSGECVSSSNARASFTASRGPVNVLSATSRGFINSSANRINDLLVASSFQATQRQSTEWNITARTSQGYGQLRITRPNLLKSVIFAGREQSAADDDALEDVDPPALKLSASQTFVASWTTDGNNSNSIVTLSISPSGGFRGITCTGPASVGKFTVPSSLISQIPANQRLWASLRIDSWQALDEARWLVRVTDWKSLGVQRF